MSDTFEDDKAALPRIVWLDTNYGHTIEHVGGWGVKTADGVTHQVSGELITQAIGSANPRDIVGAPYMWTDERGAKAIGVAFTLTDYLADDAVKAGVDQEDIARPGVVRQPAAPLPLHATFATRQEAADYLASLTEDQRAIAKVSVGSALVNLDDIRNAEGARRSYLDEEPGVRAGDGSGKVVQSHDAATANPTGTDQKVAEEIDALRSMGDAHTETAKPGDDGSKAAP